MLPTLSNLAPVASELGPFLNERGAARVIPAPVDRRAKALWTVFSQVARRQRLDQIAAILTAGARGVVSLDQLLIACRDDRIVGATLAIPGAGRAAHVWPCRLVAGEPQRTEDIVFAEQERRLAALGIVFLQAFVDLDEAHDGEKLAAHGYGVVGDLVWMACRATDFPRTKPEADLEFAPFDGDFARLEETVDRTYVDTLDCPAMNEMRRTRDVLEGYRSSPTFRADRWWTVAHSGEPVGCLLLADHPDGDQTELVYCGVAPRFRGRGWGRELTKYAQWVARGDGRQRLVLSVDAANRPALSIYAQAGFRAYDRRQVLAKTL